MAYDRRSIRLAGYDYRSAGAYFVTICTFRRDCILDDPAIREWVTAAWRRAAFDGVGPPEYEFVVMPNHLHGIVWLGPKVGAPTTVGAKHPRPRMGFGNGQLGALEVSFGNKGASPLQRLAVDQLRPPERGSLSAVIGAFKSAATKGINALRGTPSAPVWQRGFYERIIRNEDELTRVREYIRDNPAKWQDDPNNPAIARRAR